MINLLKLVVTLTFFYFIYTHYEFEKILVILKECDLLYFTGAIIAQIIAVSFASYRWYGVIDQLGFRQPLIFCIKSFFKSMFFNQVLPTSIGGDTLRVLDIAKKINNSLDAFYSVLIDRIIGISSLLLLCFIANVMQPDFLPKQLSFLILVLVSTLLISIGLLIIYENISIFINLKYLKALLHLSVRFKKIFRSQVVVLKQICLSILVNICSIFSIYLAAHSVSMNYNFITFFMVMPIVFLLLLLPVSFAGWGLRESVMVGIFSLIGANPSLVLSVSILYGLVLIVSSMPGLFLFLSARRIQ